MFFVVVVVFIVFCFVFVVVGFFVGFFFFFFLGGGGGEGAQSPFVASFPVVYISRNGLKLLPVCVHLYQYLQYDSIKPKLFSFGRLSSSLHLFPFIICYAIRCMSDLL